MPPLKCDIGIRIAIGSRIQESFRIAVPAVYFTGNVSCGSSKQYRSAAASGCLLVMGDIDTVFPENASDRRVRTIAKCGAPPAKHGIGP